MIKATLGDYVAACGNSLPAGALLKHMEYLCAHSTIVVDEHKWYVKPREDMMIEVGLTINKYNAALAKLQELGFIQVDYTTSLLPQKNNTRRTMFSVTPLAVKEVEKAVSVRKGTYVSKPQCAPEPVVTQAEPQHTVSPVVGHPSLYLNSRVYLRDSSYRTGRKCVGADIGSGNRKVFQERNKLSLLLGSKLLPTKLRSPKNIPNDDLTAVVIEMLLEVVEKEWGTFMSAAHSKSGVIHYKASMPFNEPLGDLCVLVHASPKKSGAACSTFRIQSTAA